MTDTILNRSITSIPVFYSDKMLADAHKFSPSALKPRAVVEAWNALGISIDIQAPNPVSVEEYCLVHDAEYVENVLRGYIVNGFRNRDPKVNASLAYTSGAMLDAARAALENGSVAVAPCAGFHHAGLAYGGGYCTFNGLVLAARKVIVEGRARKVGILDFDMHFGDGTEDIIQHLGLEKEIQHYSAGIDWTHPEQANDFLNAIDGFVNNMADCDLILYQAGADPHIDDPLGGFLTTEQLAKRDHKVFSQAKRLNIPVAWNLAGGYQRDSDGTINPVLQIHNGTLEACRDVWL